MRLIAQVLRQAVVGLVVLVAATALLGAAYPAVIWGASRLDTSSAEGSRIRDADGCVVGSALLGVDVAPAPGQPDRFLHGRVVGSGDDAMAPGDPSASAASQQGPGSTRLAAWIAQRRAIIAAREQVPPERVPPDAVTGSASGLDPDISPAYAAIQVDRVARANGISPDVVRRVIARHTTGRTLGVLGEPRVTVLPVNLDLGLTAPGCR